MKIKFCGAAQNVTGSRHLVEINGTKILLDCGMFQGGPSEEIRQFNETFLFKPSEVDIVILSHAHIDHVGMLPRLVSQGFKGKIYCTPVTKEITDVLLRDAAHIQLQDYEYEKKHKRDKPAPLYTEADAQAAMRLIETYSYRQKFRLADGIWVTFYDAGHVMGSAITVIDYTEPGQDQRRLVFTGDLGRKYLPLLNDPYQVDHANTLIIESTYASHLHDAFANVYEELCWAVNDVVKRGGRIIVPGFSFERTQEIVYVLHQLYDQGRIPRLPIFVDSPLSVEISDIFDKFHQYYDKESFRDFVAKKENPIYFSEVRYCQTVEESKAINDFKGSCFIISASGMCDAGRIKHHLKNNMADPRNLILVVGFMAKGTRGRDLVEGKPKIKIFGEDIPLRADVVVLNAFSAHADKLELMEYIRNIQGLEQIFIVHGEETECAVLRDNIFNILKLKCRVDVVDLGEEFEITSTGVESKLGERRQEYIEDMEALKNS